MKYCKNGEMIEMSEAQTCALRREDYTMEISALKEQLKESDYMAIKFAEGVLSENEYSQTREKRKAIRHRINTLEAMLML